MLEIIKQNLQKIGLKENEIKVYLACLQSTQGLLVVDIVKQTHIKRSTVNLILERLAKSGYITFYLDGRRKRYQAENLETIIFNFEENLKELRSILPLLIKASSHQKTKVRFFQGKDGLEYIFHDILLSCKLAKNKEILAISSGRDIFQILPDHYRKFIQKRIKERIPLRWLAPKNSVPQDIIKNSQKELREIRFFDQEKYPFDIELDIYTNKVALLDLSKNSSGIIIQNNKLTSSLRSIFNLL